MISLLMPGMLPVFSRSMRRWRASSTLSTPKSVISMPLAELLPVGRAQCPWGPPEAASPLGFRPPSSSVVQVV